MLKGLFGRLLPDIAAVIFHEYPKKRQLELIEACCAKEHEALLATPAPVYPGLVDALSILSRHYPLYIVSNCQAAISKFFWKPQASVTISKAISVLAIPERQRQTTSVQIIEQNHLQHASMSRYRRRLQGDTRGRNPVCPCRIRFWSDRKPGLHHHFPDGSCHTVRTGKLIFNSFFLKKIRIPVLITECVFFMFYFFFSQLSPLPG